MQPQIRQTPSLDGPGLNFTVIVDQEGGGWNWSAPTVAFPERSRGVAATAAPKGIIRPAYDLLRAVFSSAFGMWTPLPQVLEQCLQEIYQDAGWDLTSDDNFRGKSHPWAFPTLTTLIDKVEELTPKL